MGNKKFFVCRISDASKHMRRVERMDKSLAAIEKVSFALYSFFLSSTPLSPPPSDTRTHMKERKNKQTHTAGPVLLPQARAGAHGVQD